MTPWGASLGYALPALLITFVGLRLHRVSRDPRTSRGDAVLVDLGLGLVAVLAFVMWLQVFVSIVF